MYKTKDLELLGESYEAIYNEQLDSSSSMYAVEKCVDYEGCNLIAICSSLEDAKQICKEYIEEHTRELEEAGHEMDPYMMDEMTVTAVPGYNHRIDELPSNKTTSYRNLVNAEDGESSTEG